MYNWEIEEFLKKRNYYIGGDDLVKVISIMENPQLTYIKSYTGEWNGKKNQNLYYMTAPEEKDATKQKEFQFCAMPYEEAKAKGLVKTKNRD